MPGELESEVAGQPGRLIRERYRKAAELSRVRGKLSALMINDLDAGIGRFGNTQVGFSTQPWHCVTCFAPSAEVWCIVEVALGGQKQECFNSTHISC
jgi:hypothetical protein